MNSIFDYYIRARDTDSDIWEHIEDIYRLALECDHITEMGVRGVVTTWAFLLAKPRKLISYDSAPCPVQEVQRLAPSYNIDFNFHIADTGNPSTVIEPTDLLFIDTWHIYEQLKQELLLHGNKAQKYIIMHDTKLFGHVRSGEHYDCFVKPGPEGKGLLPAIYEFIEDNPHWAVERMCQKQMGLTVLKRLN